MFGFIKTEITVFMNIMVMAFFSNVFGGEKLNYVGNHQLKYNFNEIGKDQGESTLIIRI